MEIIKDIVSLIASILIFLGSIIALISAIGIVKFQDVFQKNVNTHLKEVNHK